MKYDYTKDEAKEYSKEVLATLPAGWRACHEWCYHNVNGKPLLYYNLRFIRRIAKGSYARLYLGSSGWFCSYPHVFDTSSFTQFRLTAREALDIALHTITEKRDQINHMLAEMNKTVV